MVEVKIFEDGKEIVQQSGKAVMAVIKVDEDDKRSAVRTLLIGDGNIISIAEDVVRGLAFCMADKCKEDGISRSGASLVLAELTRLTKLHSADCIREMYGR